MIFNFFLFIIVLWFFSIMNMHYMWIGQIFKKTVERFYCQTWVLVLSNLKVCRSSISNENYKWELSHPSIDLLTTLPLLNETLGKLLRESCSFSHYLYVYWLTLYLRMIRHRSWINRSLSRPLHPHPTPSLHAHTHTASSLPLTFKSQF